MDGVRVGEGWWVVRGQEEAQQERRDLPAAAV